VQVDQGPRCICATASCAGLIKGARAEQIVEIDELVAAVAASIRSRNPKTVRRGVVVIRHLLHHKDAAASFLEQQPGVLEPLVELMLEGAPREGGGRCNNVAARNM